MFFFVIEGDNGTGKDTVASKFIKDGFEIITYDKKFENINQDFKQIVKNKTTKYKRIIQLIKLAETNNILCIDNDITINYNNLKKFVIEFIDSKYANY